MLDSPRKKIVIIGPAHPYRGGNAMFIQYLCNALSAKFDVRLINYSLLYPSFLFPGTSQFDQSEKVIQGFPNQRLINSINPISWLNTARMIKRENADLVVFDWWNPFFGACHWAISKLLQKKYHGKILFITENFISHEARFVDSFLTKLGLRYANKFLALSAKVEQDLKGIAHGRPIYRSELPMFDYSLTPFDSEKERLELGFTKEDNVLMFFGYVRKYKGLDILLHAFPRILESLPNAKLLVVGEFYDNPEIYTNIVKQNGTADLVKFVNQFVPNEEVGKYFAAADVMVQPYRSATQSGILNVAYSFGVPAVVTRVGGLEEYVTDGVTGIVSAPESPEELAKAVVRFYSLHTSIDFSSNIRDRVSQSAFQGITDVFDQILSE
ncbi:MAG: glycosyltransferase [Ignavibacteria bacterium]|nr:glycosyltransferase [Ignavibacteria bacterium]